MTTAENMALAVLRGDLAAARALCDVLMESETYATKPIPPVRHVKVDRGRLRVLVTIPLDAGSSVHFNRDEIHEAVNRWLNGDENLILVGCHLELFEMPESMSAVAHPESGGHIPPGWVEVGEGMIARTQEGTFRQFRGHR